MKNLRKTDKASWCILILFAVFAIVNGFTYVMSGDDFWWAIIKSPLDMFGEHDINGRYFTNVITQIVIEKNYLRPVIFIPFMFLLFLLMAKSIRRDGTSRFTSYAFTAMCIFLIPTSLCSGVARWMSGFTNYVISVVMSLIYIVYCLPVFDGKPKKGSPVAAAAMAVAGALGCLCLETISIYNLCAGVFFIVYPLIRYKKTGAVNIAYLIGAAAGTVIMFSDKNYSSIASSGDDVGFSSFEIDFSDIFMTMYNDIVNYIANLYFFQHIAIAVSFVILYTRKYGTLTGKDAPKYAKVFLPFIVVFASFSLFSNIFSSFVSLTSAMRMGAVQVAATFFYVFAIVYMSYVLFDKASFSRLLFFVLSIIVLTAPFIVVKPINPRCFFATFVFWCIVAGELLMKCVPEKRTARVIKYLAIPITAFLSFAYCYIFVTDFAVDRLRIDYVREQASSRSKLIELVSLPYGTIDYDAVEIFTSDAEVKEFNIAGVKKSYQELIMEYWGITEDMSDKKYLAVSIRDYNETHSSVE